MKIPTLAEMIAAAILVPMTTVSVADPVKTEYGLVRGASENGLRVYRGVPFAAPPVGELRWKPPAPARPWNGVRDTRTFGPSCMQDRVSVFHPEQPPLTVSEDCLYLNIWTPAVSADAGLPVMVWIYGGGFQAGTTTTPLYSGEALARRGIVVVSLNYRVGVFGFLAHPGLSAESKHGSSGNYGLLDQIAALQWIRRNIAGFGGDADNVTIFGQSAGGISVSMLAASPLATGLFDKAISQSGGSFGPTHSPPLPGENVQTLEDAERIGQAFGEQLGAGSIAGLRAIPAEKLHKAAKGRMPLAWPVLDGWVIADHPYRLYSEGRYNDTPVLIGTTSDEGALFVSETTLTDYTAGVRDRYGEYADELLRLYPAADDDQALQSARDLMRDVAFGWHNWTWAELQSRTNGSPVYLYYFDHMPPQPENAPVTQGAQHGAELPYVFGHLDQQPLAWSEADRTLSETLMSHWINFARTGNPNGDDEPEWPAYTTKAPVMMHFNDTPSAGPVANLEKLKGVDAYMLSRLRSQGALD